MPKQIDIVKKNQSSIPGRTQRAAPTPKPMPTPEPTTPPVLLGLLVVAAIVMAGFVYYLYIIQP